MNVKMHDGTADFVPRLLLDIHHISAKQLAILGMEEIAFVKPVMTENGPAVAIHAADGKPIANCLQRAARGSGNYSERYGAEPGALTWGRGGSAVYQRMLRLFSIQQNLASDNSQSLVVAPTRLRVTYDACGS